MGLFSKSITCEHAGQTLAQHCTQRIHMIPNDLGAEVRVELQILAMSACHAVIQRMLSPEKMKRVITAFYQEMGSEVSLRSFWKTLQVRGDKYGQLWDEYGSDGGAFVQTMAFNLHHYCNGGADDAPLIIGGMTDLLSSSSYIKDFFCVPMSDTTTYLSSITLS